MTTLMSLNGPFELGLKPKVILKVQKYWLSQK